METLNGFFESPDVLSCVRTIVVWKRIFRIIKRIIRKLRENHSGMETLIRVLPPSRIKVLRENHSGMETQQQDLE